MPEGTWLDIGIIGILIIALIKGYFEGFLQQTASLLGVLLGIIAAISRFKFLSALLMEIIPFPPFLIHIISFVLIMILVTVVIGFVGQLLRKLTEILFLSFVDSVGGAGLGLLKGGLIVYIILLICSRVPYGAVIEYIDSSALARKFLEFTPVLQEKLDRFLQLY